MALQGTFNHIEYTAHPTETVISSITYPADMPSGSDDFDKRGTTVTESMPADVENVTTYTNKYYYVMASSVHTLNTDPTFGNTVDLAYKIGVWDDQASKNTDYDNPITTLSYDMEWDWSVHTNPTEEAYNHFKSIATLSTSSLTDN